MGWPTPQDYNEAVQSPRVCFGDPELKSGQVETDKLGLPRPISGRFAVVYKIRCGSKDFAVRCFQNDVPDQNARYAAISDHLKRVHLHYTVGFEFQSEGIRIKGLWYPILKMEWIVGVPLNLYIEQNLRNPVALYNLANRWMSMAQALRSASIAHGDLQDGNVLVVGNDLKLIDYDGMYVPALSGRPSNEVGHRNYQHPNRTAMDYALYLDNFSDWVIYLSIVALAIDPGLWTRLKAGDECLLFRKEDYNPSSGSTALSILSKHSDTRLRNLASVFESMLYLLPAQVPPLTSSDAVDLNSLPQPVQPSSGSSWLTDHLKQSTPTPSGNPRAPQPSPPISSPTWIIDFITPSTATKTFQRPLGNLRAAMAALLCIMMLVPFSHGGYVTLGGEWLLATIAGSLFLIAYRRDPISIERARLIERERSLKDTLYSLEHQIKVHENNVATLHEEEAKAKADIGKERDEAKKSQQKALDRLSRELKAKEESLDARHQQLMRPLQKAQADYNSRVTKLNQEIAQSHQQQANEIATALKPIQDRYVEERLRSAYISHARIPGIGPKLIAELNRNGFYTAADVSYRVQYVSGIGNVKFNSLLSWRQAILNNATRTMPSSLNQAQITTITSKHEAFRQQCQQQVASAKTYFEDQERLIKQQSASAQAVLTSERKTATDYFQRQTQAVSSHYAPIFNRFVQREAAITKEYEVKRAAEEQLTQKVRKSIYDKTWALAKLRKELDAYRRVTLGAFFLVVVANRYSLRSS